jgi:hypothetical protein
MKGVRVVVFNATFNNVSAISWVLLVEETGENHFLQWKSNLHKMGDLSWGDKLFVFYYLNSSEIRPYKRVTSILRKWFSPVSSTNKTHDIADTLLKVALNTTTLTPFIAERGGTTIFHNKVSKIYWLIILY